MLVHDGPELVDLGFRQELALVHDDDVTVPVFPIQEPLQNIGFRRNDLHLRLQPDAAAQYGSSVPDIRAGLDEPHFQIIFLVIVLGNQRLGRFAGTHSAVFEI